LSKVIMLTDMESFFASVEVAKNPSLQGRPVVVCGDPQRRHGIVLAASREAKAFGVKTGMVAGQGSRLCPHAVFIRPHMQDYLDVSLKITGILHGFSDRIAPYSIDEQFLDVTGCEKLFGSPEEMAQRIIEEIWRQTRVRGRVGIGENPLQAKMACDNFAKKNKTGIFRLSGGNYARLTWPLPIRCLFGVGVRMERNFFNIGVTKIGHLAGLTREDLARRWGINGEVLWQNAHGFDASRIEAPAGYEDRKGVGNMVTLPRDYRKKHEIEVVLLEITEEVCRRARRMGKVGWVANVYCRGADFDAPTGFSRQMRMPEPTAAAMDVYPRVLKIFYTHWDYRPVRTLGVTLSGLIDFADYQLSLTENREKKIALNRAMDIIRARYGATSLFRLSSLESGGMLFDRASKIGGHEA